jgi:preprotein translocase SecF subunit
VSLTNREVTLTVVAALLTIAGFSINDTIVVFDRIRERKQSLRREPAEKVMNIAVNETMSRTIITSFTVFLTVLSLFLFGGEVIHDFSFAMLVGIVFGTYSSVYVASGPRAR